MVSPLMPLRSERPLPRRPLRGRCYPATGPPASVADDAVATGVLGRVERTVRPRDQLRAVLGAVPADDPGGGGALVGSRGAQALEEPRRLLRVAVDERDRELVAAVAGDQVGGPQRPLPLGRGLLQQPV